MCQYHPEMPILLSYAAGKLNFYQTLMVELHKDVCSTCSAVINELESLGGKGLEEAKSTNVSDSSFKLLMSKIEAENGAESSTTLDEIEHQETPLSNTLKNILLKNQEEGLNWHWRTKRFAEIPLTSANDEQFEAKLIYFKKGMKVPKHTHRKQEVTLVLKGAFSDSAGVYKRGDYIRRTSEHEHSPVAESDCICLAITDAPLKFTGTFGPVMNWLFK